MFVNIQVQLFSYKTEFISKDQHSSCKMDQYLENVLEQIKFHLIAGLPLSGKNIWKMKFVPGQGKVREFVDCQGI